MELSVVIATRNRSDALEKISLPSLGKQDFKAFETIVWDASDDERSKDVAEKFISFHPEMKIWYFKAPRKGLASQRNDSVRAANGEVVFFIDDDSEVSPDGISFLLNAFESDEGLAGAALPMDDKLHLEMAEKNGRKGSAYKVVSRVFKTFFFLDHETERSKVYLSGHCGSQLKKPGYAAHLRGCDMAFRSEIFDDHEFEEKLQKISGWAFNEDLQFTQKLHRENKRLLITEKGHLLHHSALNSRPQRKELVAMAIYNNFIVWKTAVCPFKKYSILIYTWSLIGQIFYYLLIYLRHPKEKTCILKGIALGIKTIRDFLKAGGDGLENSD